MCLIPGGRESIVIVDECHALWCNDRVATYYRRGVRAAWPVDRRADRCFGFLGAIGVANGSPGTLSAVPGAIGLCVIYGPVFGFLMGFAPAATAGAVLALLGPSRSGRKHAVIISALVSAAYAAMLLAERLGDPETGHEGTMLMAGVIVASGTVSGAVCWRIVEALVGTRRQTPTNPSSTPPPAT